MEGFATICKDRKEFNGGSLLLFNCNNLTREELNLLKKSVFKYNQLVYEHLSFSGSTCVASKYAHWHLIALVRYYI